LAYDPRIKLGNVRRFQAVFVLVVLGMAISVLPFCHTEKTIGESRTCPACQFSHASAAVILIADVPVIPQRFIGTVAPAAIPLHAAARLDGAESRSPPLV
jgi:hypothetical protein